MSDPNPYHPPREPEPLSKAQILKRGVGVGVILALTPVAVGIAALGGCGMVYLVLDSRVMPNNLGAIVAIGWAVFLTPPLLTSIGMIWWMVRANSRNRQARQSAAIAAFWKEEEKRRENID